MQQPKSPDFLETQTQLQVLLQHLLQMTHGLVAVTQPIHGVAASQTNHRFNQQSLD
jgi:hypothetical protein